MSDQPDQSQDQDRVLLPPEEALPAGHRSGFVAVVGQPNVGKSTLMNRLVGHKIAIVTPKPQTTRRLIRGFLTRPDAQVIFVDTPGIHDPYDTLGEFMVDLAVEALPDADLILFLVDVSHPPNAKDQEIVTAIAAAGVPAILVLNKADLVPADELDERVVAYRGLGEWVDSVIVSLTEGRHVEELLDTIVAHLPEGPRFYPPEQLSDQQEREIVAELIREQAILQLEQEIPYGLDVQVEEFKERENDLIYINANVIVEREAHKPIVIGAGGRKLKAIGAAARREIEQFLGQRVFLELWAKVRPKWRRDEQTLRRWGYAPPRKRR
ncbi:MAG: GTPase Era [Ardenticatenaceae bacterium]|nr:GTPase Era [Ardenticatenaceae bacterium]HBY99011.1 GTPase Era [Chloroflexota bacterium]